MILDVVYEFPHIPLDADEFGLRGCVCQHWWVIHRGIENKEGDMVRGREKEKIGGGKVGDSVVGMCCLRGLY